MSRVKNLVLRERVVSKRKKQNVNIFDTQDSFRLKKCFVQIIGSMNEQTSILVKLLPERVRVQRLFECPN